jgi:hypothetical protein
MRPWRTAIVLLVFSGFLLGAAGCASEQRSYDSEDSIESIEQPADSFEEEESLSDKAGEVGVVLLAIGTVAAGVALPFLLF